VDHLDKKWVEMEEKIKAINILNLDEKKPIENDVDSDEELLKSMENQPSLPVTPLSNTPQHGTPILNNDPLNSVKDQQLKSPRKSRDNIVSDFSGSDSKSTTPSSSFNRGSNALDAPIIIEEKDNTPPQPVTTLNAPGMKKRLSMGSLLKPKDSFQEKTITTPQPESKETKELKGESLKKKSSVFQLFKKE